MYRYYDESKKPGKHCYKCSDKEMGCHGKCEKYQQACAEWRKHKEEVDAKVRADYEYDDFKIKQVKATKEFMKKHSYTAKVRK